MVRSERFSSVRISLALTLLFVMLAPISVHAQLVIDPTTAEFDPSVDHSATLSDGTSLVSRYDLEFYLIGATSPFQVLNLGKPAPALDGKIRVNFTSLFSSFPTPGIVYQAAVAAIGPGGAGRSTFSNTFSFSAACSFTASPTSQTVAAAGGGASVSVTASSGCAWTATSSSSWITVTGGSSGSGAGTVAYTVAANTATTSRSGTLTVAGQTVTVTQSGAACSFTASPTSQTVVAAGGGASVSVTAGSGCKWTVTNGSSWITVTGGSNGSGNGTVTYTVAANMLTTSRSGTLTVAGRAVTVTQSQLLPPSAPGGVRIVR